MKNDQDCAENEEEVGLPVRPCWAELEGKEDKRTVAVTGLVGEAVAETRAARLLTPPEAWLAPQDPGPRAGWL